MAKQAKLLIDELRQALVVFDETSATRKLDLLEKCARLNLNSSKLISDYHNALLFVLGYSENENVFVAARNEMKRLAEAIKKLPESKKEKLDRSGIVFTETQGA